MEIKQPLSLPQRDLLGVSGADRIAFLQSVLTQDLTQLKAGVAMPAAHLTPQGRMLFDVICYQLTPDMVALETDTDQVIELAKSLHQFAVSRAVEFHDLREEYSISIAPEAVTSAAGNFTDQRLPGLPIRVVYAAKNTPDNDGIAEWLNLRLQNALPEGQSDFISGKTLPAEWGLNHLNGVAFEKGCYVGQELTARMEHRTEPKKRIFKVKLDEAATLPTHSIVTNQASEAEQGWLLSHVAGYGIALLKLRNLSADTKLAVNNVEITEITQPQWWPLPGDQPSSSALLC